MEESTDRNGNTDVSNKRKLRKFLLLELFVIGLVLVIALIAYINYL